MRYMFEGTNYVCGGEVREREGKILFQITPE
jgi:hypothetical protein